jgi:hypothetical protein
MSNLAVTQLVGACAVVFGLALFAWLVLIPAVQSYSRLWERVAAAFLSLYVLAAFIGLGILAGLAVAVWLWPRLFASVPWVWPRVL